jgi:hypothetical protein
LNPASTAPTISQLSPTFCDRRMPTVEVLSAFGDHSQWVSPLFLWMA